VDEDLHTMRAKLALSVILFMSARIHPHVQIMELTAADPVLRVPTAGSFLMLPQWDVSLECELIALKCRHTQRVPLSSERLRGGGTYHTQQEDDEIVLARPGGADEGDPETYKEIEPAATGPVLGKRGVPDSVPSEDEICGGKSECGSAEDDYQWPNEDESTSADPDELRANGGFWVAPQPCASLPEPGL